MAETNSKKGAPAANEAALSQNEAFILKYKYPIIGAVIVLVLAIAAYLFFSNQSKASHEKAATEMAKGQEYFNIGMNYFDEANFEQALNGDSVGFAGFAKLATELSGDDGNLANLYAGLCCAHLDKWEEAAQYLEKFDGVGDQMISPAALGALGNVYAHLNQLDKAVETLKKAAKEADNLSLSPNFLIQAGQILESQDKKAEALAAYQEAKTFIEKMPQQMQAQTGRFDIDAYIERVSE